MTLSEFLAQPEQDRTAFAKALGVTPEAVRLWELGKRMPRRKHLEQIAVATNGGVTANDFFASADAA